MPYVCQLHSEGVLLQRQSTRFLYRLFHEVYTCSDYTRRAIQIGLLLSISYHGNYTCLIKMYQMKNENTSNNMMHVVTLFSNKCLILFNTSQYVRVSSNGFLGRYAEQSTNHFHLYRTKYISFYILIKACWIWHFARE